jgi:hypothetical protein
MGWARGSEEGEFECGLEGASLESLDSLSRDSAMVRRNQRDAKFEDERDMDTESSEPRRRPDPRGETP